jgi:hypothetical protein
MTRLLLKSLTCAVTFAALLTLTINSASALSCSYTYTVNGGDMRLMPSLSADTVYFRWIIDKVDNTETRGQTAWIDKNYIFTQIFALDYASEYHIFLQVKDASGNIVEDAKFIYTTQSSLSVQEKLTVTEDAKTMGRENIFDSISSFFNSFSLMGKAFLFIISIIIFIFLIDTAFSVTNKKKTLLYKIVYRRK